MANPYSTALSYFTPSPEALAARRRARTPRALQAEAFQEGFEEQTRLNKAAAALAEDRAREQERQQREAQKAAEAAATLERKQAQAAQEEEFRRSGRPFFTDALGNLKPTQDDATWAAMQKDKAAKAAALAQAQKDKEWRRQEAINLKLQEQELHRRQRELDIESTQADLRASEAGVAATRLAAQIKTLEQKRDSATPEEFAAIEPALGALRQQLAGFETKKAEAEDARRAAQAKRLARQQEALGAQADLDRAAIALPGQSAPVSPSPATPTAPAPESSRVTQTPRLPAPAQQAVITPLTPPAPAAGNPALRATWLEERARAAAADTRLDTQAALNRAHALRKRAADPAAWLEEQTALADSLPLPELEKHAATVAAELERQIPALNERASRLRQEQAATQARLTALEKQNAARLLRPLADKDVVTLSRPDGQSMRWERSLAEQYLAEVGNAKTWQEKNQAALDQVELESTELQLDQELLKRQHERLRAKASTARQEQLASLSSQGFAAQAASLAALDQDIERRRQAILQRLPAGSPAQAAALRALEQSAVKESNDLPLPTPQQMQAGLELHKSLEVGQPTAWRTTQDEGTLRALREQATALGLNEEQARFWLDYFQKSDWSKPLKFDAKNGRPVPETFRILPTGDVTISPTLWADQEKYAQAVKDSLVDEAAQKRALDKFPDLQKQTAASILPTLANAPAIPGMTTFMQWREDKLETDRARFAPLSVEAQVVEYLDEMKKRPWWSKLRDQINRNFVAGWQDIATAELGSLAMLTGSKSLSNLAAANSANTSSIIAPGEMDGTNANWALKVAGLTARMGPTAVATAGVGAIHGLTAAAITGGAMTAGTLFGDSYGQLRRQNLPHDQAYQRAALSSAAAGAFTALLTAGMGKTGLERLLLDRATPARQTFQAYLGQIARAAGEEIPEEVVDEWLSTLSQAIATRPKEDPVKVIKEFGAELPTLVGATGLLGGAGGALQGRGGDGLAPGSPEATAAAWAEIENFADPTLAPEEQEAARRRASVALALAQGGALRDVEMADLEAAGWTRDAQDRFVPLPGYTGPQVLDVVGNDQAVIKDSYTTALESALPAVRAQIQGTETAVRNRLSAAAPAGAVSSSGSRTSQPGLGTGPRPASPASPVATAPAVPPAGGGQASVSPLSAPVASVAVGPAAGVQTRGTSGQGPAATAQGVAGVTPGVAAAPPAAAIPPTPEAARVAEISAHLQSAGMPARQADAIATAAVQRHGIEGKTYAEQVTGPRFASFLDSLGVTGSRRSQDAATNPLRAPADLAQRLLAPPEVGDLRQKLTARTISDQDAVRELARRASITDPAALLAAAQNLLGFKPARAQIAVDLVTPDNGPLAAAPRATPAKPAAPPSQSTATATTASTPAEPVPASVQALRKNAAWTRAKMAALAGVKDAKRKAWAREVIASLEKSIAGRHLLYEALGAGPAARRMLKGQMLAVQEVQGRITLLVDLAALFEQFADTASPAEAVAATGVEEAVHAAVLHLARQNPQRYGRAALLRQWQDLPPEIRARVWQAYHAAGTASLPVLPSSLTPGQEWALMNEFLRMLVQDAGFASQVTESVSPSSSLPAFVRQFLQDLGALLRSLVSGLPQAQRAALESQVQEITTTLRELEARSETQASRAATLPAVRLAGAAALQSIRTGALFEVLATRDQDFTPAFLARAWDSLPPGLQSFVFRRRPRTDRRAPKADLMRETLALLASDPATARAAMAVLVNPPPVEQAATRTGTSFLRRLLGNLRASLAAALGRPLSPSLESLLSPASPAARQALATLHARVLAASAYFEAAATVDSFLPPPPAQAGSTTATPSFQPSPPSLQARQSAEAMLEAWAAMDAAEHALPGVSDEVQRRALARSLARQELESQLLPALQMRLDARLGRRPPAPAPATPAPPPAPAWVPNPPATGARRSAEAMLQEWSKLEAAEQALPGVGAEIQRRALQRRLAAEMWARALIGLSASAEQRRAIAAGTLTPQEMMVLQDALTVARGDFVLGTAYDRRQLSASQEDGTAVRMLGYGKEAVLGRLGILIAPDGTLYADPNARAGGPAYVERNHIILRQSFLDDLAARLPVTRTLIAMSEAQARRHFGLPAGAIQPTTARDIAATRQAEAEARTAQNLEKRLASLEQETAAATESTGPRATGLPDPTGGNDLVSWMDREGWALGYYQDTTSGEWDWLRELERAAAQSKEHASTIAKYAREGDITHPRARLRWLQDQGLIDPSKTTSTLDEVEMAAQEAGFDVSQGLGNLLMATLDARLAARSSPSTSTASGPALATEEAQALRFARDTATGPITVQPGELVQAFLESPTPPYVLLKDAQGQPHRVTVVDATWQPMDPDSPEMEDYQENSPWFQGREEGRPQRLVVTLQDGTTYGRQTVPAEDPLRVDAVADSGQALAAPPAETQPAPSPAAAAPASPVARTAAPLATPNDPNLGRQLDAQMWENRQAAEDLENQIPDEIDLAAEADDYLDSLAAAARKKVEEPAHPRSPAPGVAMITTFKSELADPVLRETLPRAAELWEKHWGAFDLRQIRVRDQGIDFKPYELGVFSAPKLGGPPNHIGIKPHADALLTFIHEIAHAWDYHLNFQSGKFTSEEPGQSPAMDKVMRFLTTGSKSGRDLTAMVKRFNKAPRTAFIRSALDEARYFSRPEERFARAVEQATRYLLTGTVAKSRNLPYVYLKLEETQAILPLLYELFQTKPAAAENASGRSGPESAGPPSGGTSGAVDSGRDGLGSTNSGTRSPGDSPDAPGASAQVTPPLAASQRIARAAAETNTRPTPAQAEAENYKTGKVSWNGLRLSIENPRGSTRSGTDPQGKAWSITMPHHYGRILRTEGKDGDHVDFFMGPAPESSQVFVINQRKPGNGHFDEHKVMLGFPTAGSAVRGYLDSYSKGWRGYGSMVAMSLPDFKTWLETGDMTQPAATTNTEDILASAPRTPARTRQRIDFNPVVQTPFGNITSYEWASKVEEVLDQNGEFVPKRFSDWEKAVKNTETGRDIVHHFSVLKSDGTTQTVSLETALGQMAPTVKKTVQDGIRAVRRMPLHIAELSELESRHKLNVADVDEAWSNGWRKAPNQRFEEAKLPWLKESNQKEVYLGDTFIGIYSPEQLPLQNEQLHEAKLKWALAQILHPPLSTTERERMETLRRRIKKDRQILKESGITVSSEPLAAARRTALETAQAASFNPTDRALTAALGRIATQALEADPARAATEAVAAWYGSERPDAAAFRGVKEFVQREIIPETLLPREVMSLMHELNLRTAIGQQKALDVSRAMQGKPKFSDLAYPPGFAENPAHRALLFDAMEGRVPMASLPPELQALGARLRDLLVQAGREAVAAGRMSPDTFEGLRTTFMPRYTRDEAEAQTGDLFQKFKLGMQEIRAQRSTAFHVVDTSRKDKTGLPLIVAHNKGAWRFPNAQARDAFFEELIERHTLADDLNTTPGLEWMTRADKRALRAVTPAMLKAPALMTAEQRAVVERVQRTLRQRFQKEDPYVPKELVRDPVYAITRYLAQMAHDNALAEFFNAIAASPEWTSDTETRGFTPIPDHPRFGALAGKHVLKEIASQVLELADSTGQAMRLYDSILRLWKTGKTVLNPATHARNIIGNIPFSQLSGTNVLNPVNVPFYLKALRTLRNGGAEYQDLYESGVLGADYASTELKAALHEIVPPLDAGNASPDSVLANLQAMATRAAQSLKLRGWRSAALSAATGAGVGALAAGPAGAVAGAVIGAAASPIYRGLMWAYRMEDDVFKAAAYFKARAMGMDRAAAAAHVRKWFPYYDKPTSATLKGAQRTILPFLSFYRESARIGLLALKERPLSLAATLAIPSLITALSSALLGLSPEDEREIKKDLRGKGAKLLGFTPLAGMPLFSMVLPVRAADGSLQQLDLSSTHPFADFLANRVESFSGPEPFWQTWARSALSNPMLGIVYTAATGRDPFGDRTLWDSSYTPQEKRDALFGHVWKTAVPPLAPGGTSWQTLASSGRRQANKTLAVRDPVQAWARAVAGVDVRSADPNIYRLADEFRAARGLPVSTPGQAFPTDAAGRARKALFEELVQPAPAPAALARHLQTLNDLGTPVRTVDDVLEILDARRPDGVINPKALRPAFRASVPPEARRVLETALAEFQRARAATPAAFGAARARVNMTTFRRAAAAPE